MPIPLIIPVGVAAVVALIAATGGSKNAAASGGSDRDAFDALVAAAIAKGDIATLQALANQAESAGWSEEAKSIRDEIARLTATAPKPAPGGASTPATPATPATGTLAHYQTKKGDTGSSIAAMFTGNANRWTELLAVNPSTKSTQYGMAFNAGVAVLLIPANWPALPGKTTPAPVAAPVTNPSVPAGGMVQYQTMAGDTGSSIAAKFTGNASRWPELLAVNPSTKSAKYGMAFNAGVAKLNIPNGWPAKPGTTIAPKPAPAPAPPAAPAPAPSPYLDTKTPGVYVSEAGDTGSSIALKFVGSANRWTELAAVNPQYKSAKYGMAFNKGTSLHLPPNWPTYPHTTTAVVMPVDVIHATPPTAPVEDHSSDIAAKELTGYLNSIGGLAGRGKERKSDIAAWSKELGAYDAKGLYGRDLAKQVMMRGLVPVVPYYWPATGAAKAKADFTALVKTYQGSDPQRSAAWAKLITDIARA